MFKTHTVILTWFFSLITTLLFSCIMLIYITFPKQITSPSYQPYQLFQALPSKTNVYSDYKATIEEKDGRALIVKNFLESRKSPLSKYSDEFVAVADKYQLDYRLLPAISMQESNGAKFIPEDSNNPFGYGIYGGKILKFDTFEQAINTVGLGLRQNYLDQGLNTPYQIMTKYTPPSLEKGGSWAIGVASFMDDLQ